MRLIETRYTNHGIPGALPITTKPPLGAHLPQQSPLFFETEVRLSFYEVYLSSLPDQLNSSLNFQ